MKFSFINDGGLLETVLGVILFAVAVFVLIFLISLFFRKTGDLIFKIFLAIRNADKKRKDGSQTDGGDKE